MASYRINPGLRLVERVDSVQIGYGSRGVVIGGMDGADRKFLHLLRRGLPEGELEAAAEECGISAERGRALLAMLKPVLVVPPPAGLTGLRADRLAPDAAYWSAVYGSDTAELLSQRASAAVHLIGLGRTGGAIACGLAAAGVGTLLLEDMAAVGPADVGSGAYRLADVGLNRAQAARKMIAHIDPTASAHIMPDTTAPGTAAKRPRFLDLVVYTDRDVPSPDAALALAEGGNPHLAVLLRESDALVGPLVVPGETACLDCVDRHQAQKDRDWNEISGLLRQSDSAGLPAVDEVAQSIAAAGIATLQALLFLDGRNRPAAWSAVLQLRSADGTVGRHEYEPHSACVCQLQPDLRRSKQAS
ncbi:NAD/FAD binding protein, UBA/THIF-type [Arthrobacter crystallopoietes BAB-32]|uniref:NAD/FAD binding protein, UBA/THIF-type n=1 Tax=Arthrobacter crystallopoietes BAB-32 TaxID=1246476 RepID=N1V5I8_9MICC|nr:TOMM precursor leader peptide-binding protein [Arthrobacter crystallopoietes]EMY33528.1 NAD/FAD binding protein, UBA/THIF-type [Arthrobacter crystallopoietes BAB-32]